MTEPVCRSCRANPPATEGLCIACLRDKLAAGKERRRVEEQRERQRRRRYRQTPAWPEPEAAE